MSRPETGTTAYTVLMDRNGIDEAICPAVRVTSANETRHPDNQPILTGFAAHDPYGGGYGDGQFVDPKGGGASIDSTGSGQSSDPYGGGS